MSEATWEGRSLRELVGDRPLSDEANDGFEEEVAVEPTEEERAAFMEEARALQAAHERRVALVRRDARASFRAVAGWGEVETEADWERVAEGAVEAYRDGSFLLGRLGAERVVDPELTAVLLALRQSLIEDHGATGAAELMLVDCAVIAYRNLLRAAGWAGDAALWTEHEWFGGDAPAVALERQHGRTAVAAFKAEERIARLGQQLVPLIDRVNRMLIRNLRALRELRSPSLAMTVQNYGQVNVGQTQTNTAGAPLGPGEGQPSRRQQRRG